MCVCVYLLLVAADRPQVNAIVDCYQIANSSLRLSLGTGGFGKPVGKFFLRQWIQCQSGSFILTACFKSANHYLAATYLTTRSLCFAFGIFPV